MSLKFPLLACASAHPARALGRSDTELGGAILANLAAPGLRAAALAMVLTLTYTVPRTAGAQQLVRQSIGTCSIDQIEVTIRALAAFADANGLVTGPELAEDGFGWAGGWTKRAGWTFHTPYGTPSASDDDPAGHVTWAEASADRTWAGGRLPSVAE